MRSTSSGKRPLRIGWCEWVSLPAFGVDAIKAKIDTGAKTSAIHAWRIRELRVGGRAFAEFVLHPAEGRSRPEILCRAPIAGRRVIKSSNGIGEARIIIRTRLKVGKRSWPIDLSLANRDQMGFRLLIGRDALGERALIHPAREYMLGEPELR
ncbi:MAG TPA: ATP-dependent zinc protease [Parvularcula sp.]|nr:ATP-dependent zinc protease [Parvularcula sp.]HBS32210.1 ATP-dependent zinc protease [Parvularcula sp.]HBS35099.1 ATP-dependent zinc protease [Parvularcula sp.]